MLGKRIIVSIIVLAGVLAMALILRHTRCGRRTEVEVDGLTRDEIQGQHNKRHAKGVGWDLTLWTSGSYFLPPNPIDFTIQLRSSVPRKASSVGGEFRFILKSLDDGDMVRENIVKARSHRRVGGQAGVYEFVLEDVFKTDCREWERSSPLRVGRYLIGVKATLEDGTEFSLENIPVEVGTMTGR